MTNWTKIVNANSLTHCRIAAKMNFLLFFPTRSRMIDRFLSWGDHGKPKSGKIKGRCQPPLFSTIIFARFRTFLGFVSIKTSELRLPCAFSTLPRRKISHGVKSRTWRTRNGSGYLVFPQQTRRLRL